MSGLRGFVWRPRGRSLWRWRCQVCRWSNWAADASAANDHVLNHLCVIHTLGRRRDR